MGIYDTMQYVAPDVATICTGLAASMGAVLLVAGKKGRELLYNTAELWSTSLLLACRASLPTWRFHTTWSRHWGKSCMIFSFPHRKDLWRHRKDSRRRDKWMTSHEAKAYGIVDEVLDRNNPRKKSNNLFWSGFCCKDIKSKHIWLSLRKISNALLRKRKKEAVLLIAGIDGHICEMCVEQNLPHSQWRSAEKGGPTQFSLPENFKPQEIKTTWINICYWSRRSQKCLSVAVYNHYKRLRQKIERRSYEIEKIQYFLLERQAREENSDGQNDCQISGCTLCNRRCHSFTEAGYVGRRWNQCFPGCPGLWLQCEAAEKGIVYIDEMIKLPERATTPPLPAMFQGRCTTSHAQIAGRHQVNVPSGRSKTPGAKMIKVDTSKILFICGGAFDSIDKVFARRLNTQVIGYKEEAVQIDKENLLQYISHKDLKAFGLIPELIGRLPVLTYLDPLDKATLISILTQPKNAIIKQYSKLFWIGGHTPCFHRRALDYVAEKALEYKLGAKGFALFCVKPSWPMPCLNCHHNPR